MEEFLKSAGGIASSISAVIALLTLILFKPARKALEKRKKRREDFEGKVLGELEKITTGLSSLGDDVAELQRDRLCQAHESYMRQGWCPPEKKRELCDWHRMYAQKGRNHLAEHYEDDLLGLPDFPA